MHRRAGRHARLPRRHRAAGIVCLAGVPAGQDFDLDVGGLNRTMVLDNDVVFGSVNANRRHYEMAAKRSRGRTALARRA